MCHCNSVIYFPSYSYVCISFKVTPNVERTLTQ